MKQKILQVLPHAVAVIVFLIIAKLFFSGINEEYGLQQPDMDKVMGMSKELSDYRLMNGEEALWSNNMFGGMPGYQTNLNYPSNWARAIDRILKWGTDPAIGSLYMCMFGFYVLMLCMRVNPWLAIVGAISFGLSTINILYIGGGHTSKVNAIGYMAPVLGGLILALRGRWLLGGAVFALFFSLHLGSNHLQMTYYLAFLLAAVATSEAIRLMMQRKWVDIGKAILAITTAGIIGLMPNYASLSTTYEYSKLTTRGKTDLSIKPQGKEDSAQAADGLNTNYILEYNMAAGEPWSMIIPNAKGGSSSTPLSDNKKALQKAPKEVRENLQGFPQYWGAQGSSAGAFYFGAGIMFLFVLAIILAKDSIKWAFLAISILAILLCMKDMHAINRFFIESFPMYNKFRDSKMILVLIQLIAPAMAIVYLNELVKTPLQGKQLKTFFIASGALLAVLLLVVTTPSVTGPLISENEVEYLDGLRTQYKGNAGALNMVDSIEEALPNVRSVVFSEDAQRSLLIVVALLALTILTAMNKIRWYVLTGAAILIITGDMWSVSSRYFSNKKEKNQRTGKLEFAHYERIEDRLFPYAADTCDKYILRKESASIPDYSEQLSKLENSMSNSAPYKGKDSNRIHAACEFGVLQLNSNYRVLLASPGIFSDASVAYFHKSIGGYHAAKLKRYQEVVDFYLSGEINRVSEGIKTGSPATVDSVLSTTPVLNMLNTKYVKYSGSAPPINNEKHALGNAWFVNKIDWVTSADAEMQALSSINPSTTAVVNEEFKSALSNWQTVDSTATVKMTKYATKKLSYEVKTPAPAAVLFSEIYYPAGWVCRIDGKEVSGFRANYILRGVEVPAGEHSIEWSFEPKSYSIGIQVNTAGSFALVILTLLIFGTEIFKWWKKESL
jgi:hypothetical protein